MANRNWASGGKMYSMHKEPVMITTTINVGASGAVTSFLGSTTQSVTRQSAGVYAIKLQPGTNFPVLLAAHGIAVSPTSGLSGVVAFEIANNPNAASALVDGALLTVTCLNASGAAADPASGSQVKVMAIYNNSSVKS